MPRTSVNNKSAILINFFSVHKSLVISWQLLGKYSKFIINKRAIYLNEERWKFCKNLKILKNTLGLINKMATCFLFVCFFVKYILPVILRDCPQVHLDTASSVRGQKHTPPFRGWWSRQGQYQHFAVPIRANLSMKRMTR